MPIAAVNQSLKQFAINGMYKSWYTTGDTIIGINQGTKKFTVLGLLAYKYYAGITVYATGSNAGTYTIVTSDEIGGNTEITVNESIPSPTIDGYLRIGETIQITGSTGNDGNYTAITTEETGGITVITVAETIPSVVANGYLGNVQINQLAAETKKGYYKDREMPVGFYYYVVYSVDKQENYADPSSIIQKFSPTDITPPATPTGLVVRRSSKYNSVELYWNELEQYDLKGYIVRRTVNPLGEEIIDVDTGTRTFTVRGLVSYKYYTGVTVYVTGSNAGTYVVSSSTEVGGNTEVRIDPPTMPSPNIDGRLGFGDWETIGLTSSNKFTDSDIPIGHDTGYQRTDVAYYLEAYDQDGNVSNPTSATSIFEIPKIKGVRVNLDYLSLNIYWDEPMPEDNVEAVACLMRLKGSSAWIFLGVSEWPKNFFRVDGPLTINTDYELALAVVKSGVHPIIEHDDSGATGIFKIAGDQTAKFPNTDQLVIYESSNLGGVYDILNNSYSAPLTGITTDGAVPAEYTVNGIDLTRNYIQISGDHISEFQELDGDGIVRTKLVNISVFGSTGNDGRYRVLSVDLYIGQTRLFLQETLTDTTPDGDVTSGTLINITDLLETIQVPIQLIPIPDYEQDNTRPTSPAVMTAVDDPENRRAFLNWSKVIAEEDFYEFHVEINTQGGDFVITAVDQTNDHFTIAGDQRAYFVIGQQIYIYGINGNEGWYDVVNVILNGVNTEIYVQDQIPSATPGDKLSTDYAWILLDRTKNTGLQAYFPYNYDYTYWFRVRAVDRTGNKSVPDACITSLAWVNPFATPANLDLPQWIDYTESYNPNSYMDVNFRRYILTVNDGARNSKWFKRYALFFALGAYTATPETLFNSPLTKDEIVAFVDRNAFTWETIQNPSSAPTVPTDIRIWIWPGVEDVEGNVWIGPVKSILEIPPTP